MRARGIFLAVVAATALLLASCGSSDSGSDKVDTGKGDKDTSTTDASGSSEAAPATTDALDGKAFTSTDIEGYELPDGATLRFTFGDGRLSVTGGCNNQAAAYDVKDGTLSWTETPAATMMACDEALMDVDTWLAGWLTDGVDATLDGDQLVLTGDDVTLTLVDDSQVQAELPLVGTQWTLTSIVNKDAVSSIPTDVDPPTLLIAEDDSAAVFTGCNNGSSTVTLSEDGSVATFSPLTMTRMACGDAATQVENAVTTVLDGETQVSIDGNELTLTNDGNSLIYGVA